VSKKGEEFLQKKEGPPSKNRLERRRIGPRDGQQGEGPQLLKKAIKSLFGESKQRKNGERAYQQGRILSKKTDREFISIKEGQEAGRGEKNVEGNER